MRKIYLLAMALLCSLCLFAQKPAMYLDESGSSGKNPLVLQPQWAARKTIPARYKAQILTALGYFPELQNTPIIFRLEHCCCKALTTRPTWLSVLKSRGHRSFVITIRDMRNKKLEPVRFQDIPFNVQVGVIGHELSHVADFNRSSTARLFGNLAHFFSPTRTDRFEFKTDSICIAHGLGYQLLAWSSYVHANLHRKNWLGAGSRDEALIGRERYMNPTTIRKRIGLDPKYEGIAHWDTGQ